MNGPPGAPSGSPSRCRTAVLYREALRRLVGSMPKAELHLHLDGSLRVETALEFARSADLVDAPKTYAEMHAALCAPPRTTDQPELLSWYDLPVRLLQTTSNLTRATAELIEDKARDRVRYVELKWAPILHTQLGLSLDAAIAAVCTGVRSAARQTGVSVGVVVCGLRTHTPAQNLAVAAAASEFAAEGVVGFDFAGPEEGTLGPSANRAAFERARAGGLGITIHAGEAPDGGESVAEALAMEPHRIAHGVSAHGHNALKERIRSQGVTLDICVTSNLQAGGFTDVSEHPLVDLVRDGIPVTLSTDSRTITGIDLSEEYALAVGQLGLELPELWSMNCHALDVGFVDNEALASLRVEFDTWAAAIPELRVCG